MGTHCLAGVGMALLVARQRTWYTRHRELLLFLFTLHLTWIVSVGGSWENGWLGGWVGRAQTAGRSRRSWPAACGACRTARPGPAFAWGDPTSCLLAPTCHHPTRTLTAVPPACLPAALGGGTNILAAHAGSPLLLLGLLLVYNPALWLCSYTLYPRLVMSSNFVSLPLLALLPVRW